MRFDEQFLRGVLVQVELIESTFPEDFRVAVDTRDLKSGDIFVALPGQKADGHDFIDEALKKGAAGLIVAEHKKDVVKKIAAARLKKKLIIIVPDTLEALVKLAAAWRARFDCPVVGITGSVGKTSTREMLANILALNDTAFVVSHGNQNTKIGVAMNMLKMRSHHKIALFEMGINKRGEMAKLASLVRPTIGVITGVGHSHMEGLGSLADIALEKRDVFSCFTQESIGVVYGDQPVLGNVAYPHPVVKFGSKTTNQIQARKIRVSSNAVSFVLKIYKNKYSVVINQPRESNVYNALAATAAAYLLGVPDDIIVRGIQQPLVIPGRFEERSLSRGKGIMINDSYNANPESMKAALLAFQNIDTKGRKIAVLGDMLELGINSPFWHRQLGRFLRKVSSLNHVILVGNMVEWTKKTAPAGLTIDIVPTWNEAAKKLKKTLEDDSSVLVKGSHSVGLHNLVEVFTDG